MLKKIIGIGGDLGGFHFQLADLIEAESAKEKSAEKLKIINVNEVLRDLLEPGREGFRQILNFFSQEFLNKKGYLNFNKLWKYLYQDHNKLRIFNFSLFPVITNEIQKMLDQAEQEGIEKIIIVADSFAENNWGKYLNELIWLNSDLTIRKNNFLELNKKYNEKYFDMLERTTKLLEYKPKFIDSEIEIQKFEDLNQIISKFSVFEI